MVFNSRQYDRKLSRTEVSASGSVIDAASTYGINIDFRAGGRRFGYRIFKVQSAHYYHMYMIYKLQSVAVNSPESTEKAEYMISKICEKCSILPSRSPMPQRRRRSE